MALSLFYAKVLGLYLLIMALIMILRKKQMEATVADFFATKGILLFAGVFNLFIGLIIVISHPVWEWNWRGLITLLGYIALIKGIFRLGFPEQSRVLEPKLIKGYWVILAITLVMGIYLTYSGFRG